MARGTHGRGHRPARGLRHQRGRAPRRLECSTAIEGRQDPARPGYGGYLVSEQTFGDFELELEMNPDWPADTGIMLRRRPGEDWAGFQVLVDHRKSGSIGGFYGNGIGGFHAVR